MNNQYMTFTNAQENLNDEDTDLKPVLIGPYGKNRVPLAIEFIFTISRILTVIAAVAVTILSLLNHADWLVLIVRLVVTIGVVGLFGYFASWLVGKYYIQAAVDELKDIEVKINEKAAEENQLDLEL